MDYTPWIPTDQDRQESPNPWAETNGCESFAMVHCIEIQERKLTGTEVDYSEQIVCVGSGTNPASGNSVGNVFNWIDKIARECYFVLQKSKRILKGETDGK